MRRAAFLRVLAFTGFGLGILGTHSSPTFAQSEPSATDIDTARTAFQQALELRDKRHDLRGAIDKLKAAYALVPTPRIGLELGKTYQQSGQLVEARAAFLDVDRLPESVVVQGARRPESAEAKKARDDCRTAANDLDARIPSIVIRVHGEGQVTVDGVNVPAESLTVPRRMNPGKHVVALMMDEGVGSRKVVDLHEGSETAVVDLTVRALDKDTNAHDVTTNTPPDLTLAENPTRKAALGWSYVMMGVGLGTDIVAYYITTNAQKDCSTNKVCPSLSSKSTSIAFAVVGDVLIGAGAITFFVGLFLPKTVAPTTPQVGFAPLDGGGFLSTQGRF